MYVLLVCNFRLLRTVLRPHGTCWFLQKWVPSMPVLLNLLITLRNMELQVGGVCKEHGAAGTSTRAFANHCFSRLKFVGTT